GYSGFGSGGYSGFGSGSSSVSSASAGAGSNDNGVLDTSVDSAARAKYTKLKGNGRDTATVMVYMCGADLESSYGMGTSDLKEMTQANFDSNVNLIVYTGGCRKWQNNIVSSSANQIYQVKPGGLTRLEDSFAKQSMTDPESLTAFIKYASKNFPADRYDLILWDHGSGTSGGYGHDEKYSTSGSMSLDEIDSALTAGGIKYDFIGFDACLMATLENALMLSDHADYLIASEETEPGTGWYYTNWLTMLSKNTAISTPELGKQIADDFHAASQRAGQSDELTLSVTDLSELSETVPEAFTAFAESMLTLVENDDYSAVSKARSSAREFAVSNKLDQVDVSDFAAKLGTSEGAALAKAVQNAVKYNRTSRSYGKAYGLSIYFPYKKVSYLDKVISIYKKIGFDSKYTSCIKKFANLEVSGQTAGGGTWSPYSSLFGGSGYGNTVSGYSSGSSSYSSSSAGSAMTELLIESLLNSGSFGRISGLTGSNTKFIEEDEVRSAADYIAGNHINTDNLKWVNNKKGQKVLALTEEDWSYIQNVELSVLYDDGEGYIDLGLDAVFEYDDDDNLIGDYDNTWLAINNNPVAYYALEQIYDGDNYTIRGYVPIILNGQLSDLNILFDNDNPYGIIEGVRFRYDTDTETENGTEPNAVAKSGMLTEGDEIKFICDYYTYDGEFIDNYQLGNTLTVTDDLVISNVEIGNKATAAYCITDIYNQSYWTPEM
ncbi:MAG: clostripain-related cysteine peptidase, partial [Eubacteriales bacterium]|nr:clostripain-related cysteine peptidase [Eubacteriales bacterium]